MVTSKIFPVCGPQSNQLLTSGSICMLLMITFKVSGYFAFPFLIHSFSRRSNWVEILGTKYKVGCFLQIGMYKEEPEFARVKKILVQRDLKMILFLTKKYITTCWNDHFQAYEVEKCQEYTLGVVKHSQLFYFLPLHVVKPFGHHTMMSCIVPKYEIGE